MSKKPIRLRASHVNALLPLLLAALPELAIEEELTPEQCEAVRNVLPELVDQVAVDLMTPREYAALKRENDAFVKALVEASLLRLAACPGRVQ